MTRFSKADWLELGAQRLAEEGPDALTLERITAAAGRTRGSFYHHFKDREAFLSALMAWWQARSIDDLARRVQAAPDLDALKVILRGVALEWDARFERGVRRLAVNEPVVKTALDGVDTLRIEGLAATLKLLNPGIADAWERAFVQYAAVIGGQWLLDGADDPRIPAIQRVGNQLFGLSDA
jgi:AcrR family transcriptional regulator